MYTELFNLEKYVKVQYTICEQCEQTIDTKVKSSERDGTCSNIVFSKTIMILCCVSTATLFISLR